MALNKIISSHNVGDVSCATGDVDDLDVLGQVKGEEGVHQGLGVAVAHDLLARGKVLQVLIEEKKSETEF